MAGKLKQWLYAAIVSKRAVTESKVLTIAEGIAAAEQKG
jgi:hypothetical protein